VAENINKNATQIAGSGAAFRERLRSQLDPNDSVNFFLSIIFILVFLACLFQSIRVQQYKGEIPAGSFGSADLCMQYLEKSAMIGRAGQRIARCLVAQLILKCPLLCHVNGDGFNTSKVSQIVLDTTTA
jgi:hypothetical protein